MQYRRARRRFDDEPENHERWLISYADFITLLFAFFVVMYAISSVNVGKYQVLSNALGEAFGNAAPQQPSAQFIPMPNPAAKRRAEALKREKERLTRLAVEL